MEKIIIEYKIPEHFSCKYIFDNNLDLLKLYSVDCFQSSIQNTIFNVEQTTDIVFSMSVPYILSLNFSNAYDFLVYIQEIKSTEFEYIRNIFLDTNRKIELSDDLFYKWLYKNENFIRSVFYSSLENFNRLKEYFVTYKLNYYNDYIRDTFDEKKIRLWFGDYNQECTDQNEEVETSYSELDECNTNNINYYFNDFHKFFVNKINCGEYEIISEDNERYIFEILNAYTFYLMLEISNLAKIPHTLSNIIRLRTSELVKLRNCYSEYKNKYDYKLYVIDCHLFNEIKYIPPGTKIITYSNIEFVKNRTSLTGSTQDLSQYIDVLNYIISIENKINIDNFYNSYGRKGFEIFNYTDCFEIFDYSDQNNYLWYEFYKILDKKHRKSFLTTLSEV